MTIRVVLGMLGADVHNKGLRAIGRMLRDRGAEVIYVGDHNTAAQLARAAADEDADVIGVSFGVASYLQHCEKLVAALAAIQAHDIPVMVGGLIHREDIDALHQAGVAGVFIPGHTFDQVVTWLEQTTGKSIGQAASRSSRARFASAPPR